MFWNLTKVQYQKYRKTWKGAPQPHLFKDTTKTEVKNITERLGSKSQPQFILFQESKMRTDCV